MRKRAGTPRHHQPRLDSLEERTLLSTIVVIPEARPSRDAIFEKLQSMPPGQWGGPSFNAAVPHALPSAGSYSTYALSGSLEKSEVAGKPEMYAPPLPPLFSGSVLSGSAGGQNTTLVVLNSGASRNAVSFMRGATTGLSAGEAGYAMASVGPLPAYISGLVVGRLVQDNNGYLSLPFHVVPGLPFNITVRANFDPSPDDRYGPLHDLHEGDDFSLLPIERVSATVDGTVQPQARSEHESHDVQSPPISASPVGSTTVPARVVAMGHENTLSFDLESAFGRSLMPISGVSISAMETVSAIAAEAVSATESALGSVIAARNVSEPRARGAVPQTESETPAPQGLGPIADLLPFDSHTVAEAIDHFFDRFEDLDSSTDTDDNCEPAALYPPPGALLLAVATLEVARRHLKRQREADASSRPRRRVVEGLGFEESFGSSGPWSSRLS